VLLKTPESNSGVFFANKIQVVSRQKRTRSRKCQTTSDKNSCEDIIEFIDMMYNNS